MKLRLVFGGLATAAVLVATSGPAWSFDGTEATEGADADTTTQIGATSTTTQVTPTASCVDAAKSTAEFDSSMATPSADGSVQVPAPDDPDYVAAVDAAAQDACTYTVETTSDAPILADDVAPTEPGPCGTNPCTTSASTAGAYGELVAGDGTQLSAALATASYPIYTRTWAQTRTGANWRERSWGRVFFDYHGHVWSTTTTYGRLGYHHCDDDWAYGVSISHKYCNTERRYDLWGAGGYPISEWDRFKVSAFYKGFPISASHTQHVNIYANGNIYSH